MITLRPAAERAHANHGWLDSWHSFSFAGYNDPRHMHWGPLRVINEDRVAAGQGFGEHGHRDMEIISYVLDGALGHKDSMGTSSSIVPGDVQRMSAGAGVQHSEFNHSETVQTHFLQIWILPDVQGGAPSYAQQHFGTQDKRGRLRLVASPDGDAGSVSIRQDARLYAGVFGGDERAEMPLAPGRPGYVHMVRGSATINDRTLSAGDALLYEDESVVMIEHGRDAAEVLVFDLPRI